MNAVTLGSYWLVGIAVNFYGLVMFTIVVAILNAALLHWAIPSLCRAFCRFLRQLSSLALALFTTIAALLCFIAWLWMQMPGGSADPTPTPTPTPTTPTPCVAVVTCTPEAPPTLCVPPMATHWGFDAERDSLRNLEQHLRALGDPGLAGDTGKFVDAGRELVSLVENCRFMYDNIRVVSVPRWIKMHRASLLSPGDTAAANAIRQQKRVDSNIQRLWESVSECGRLRASMFGDSGYQRALEHAISQRKADLERERLSWGVWRRVEGVWARSWPATLSQEEVESAANTLVNSEVMMVELQDAHGLRLCPFEETGIMQGDWAKFGRESLTGKELDEFEGRIFAYWPPLKLGFRTRMEADAEALA